MEGLTRLVSESLARHGFDRPLDYRRLHWSHWFRCETHHSLLSVPSKPGVFALAEEITHVATGASPVPRSEGCGPVGDRRSSQATPMWDRVSDPVMLSKPRLDAPGAPDTAARRMLAVTQFYEDDDMAFVLDRMLSRPNPLRDRFASGRYFVRFVVIEDGTQRRSICNALNQWMLSAAEKATGIGSHFASSLELTPATEEVPPANHSQPNLFEVQQTSVGRTLVSTSTAEATPAPSPLAAPQLDSGAATNIHCPSPFPSGF